MNVEVAKALGWVQTPLHGWHPADAPCVSFGHWTTERCPHGIYAADDLLGWLRERNWWPYELYPDAGTVLREDGIYGAISRIVEDDDTAPIELDGATLLEFLESAVLTVAAEARS